ncbi:MAG: hypothetical protein U0792_08385 [Gemmataceae bacterium]
MWWKGLGGKAPPDLPGELNAIAAAGPDKKLTPEAVAKLQAFYLAFVARPVSEELAAKQLAWEKARVEHHTVADSIPGTMVFSAICRRPATRS